MTGNVIFREKYFIQLHVISIKFDSKLNVTIISSVKFDSELNLTIVQLYNASVHKGVSTPSHFKIFPPLLESTPPSHLLKSPIPPTLLTNRSSQVLLINRNATMKLSSIHIICVKQQDIVCFFIFKFTLKQMVGNVYINKIHARQCLYNKFIL